MKLIIAKSLFPFMSTKGKAQWQQNLIVIIFLLEQNSAIDWPVVLPTLSVAYNNLQFLFKLFSRLNSC